MGVEIRKKEFFPVSTVLATIYVENKQMFLGFEELVVGIVIFSDSFEVPVKRKGKILIRLKNDITKWCVLCAKNEK